MKIHRHTIRKIMIIGGPLVVLVGVITFFSFSRVTYTRPGLASGVANAQGAVSDPVMLPTPQYIATPPAVKAIYMSQCVVGTPSFRNKLVNLIDTTELNSVVIDIKDYSGTISFPSTNPLLAPSAMKGCGASDMRQFIATLHQKGIYVIGRITVFQDPLYTKMHPEQAVQSKSTGGPWKDPKGLSYIDVSSKPYWDVVVEISKEAHDIGFDELNYDYIRYPSDGNLSDASFINQNKPEAVEEFWKYLHDHVNPMGVKMSADLFGMTTVASDDMGIGQEIDRAWPYFDYIAPMVYPSHFAFNFEGLGDPNKNVYQVIADSMGSAVKRAEATSTGIDFIGAELIASTSPQRYAKTSYEANKLRPWLQDFSYGGTYGPTEVKAQIQATYDVGLNSWMLWSASNIYTSSALGAN